MFHPLIALGLWAFKTHKNIVRWLISNKLSLHLGKTESILFGSRQKLKAQPSLNVTIVFNSNGHTLESKSCVKYLGATIDQCLTFESMARSVIKKA